MFPNNSVSLMVGQTVVSDLANLGYFIPEGIHEQAANTCYEELKIACSVMDDVKVDKIDAFPNIEPYNYVIFPSLDVHPRKSRLEFSVMCKNLFR